MTLELGDCTFSGPALPEPFVRFELATQLTRLGLLADAKSRGFEQNWVALRRQLRASGGPQSLCSHIIAPLAARLGFDPPVRQDDVVTREGVEDGGWLMRAPCGMRLRAWSFASGTDLDAPHRTGRAYRFSPMRSAQRVLLASGEPLGVVTDGGTLRLLLCDPARQDSHIAIPLTGGSGWRARNTAPDSYCLVLALASPKGIRALPELLEAARMSQGRLTDDLRVQAREAVTGFLQGVLDNPANASEGNLHHCAEVLWAEGLVLVYRLLFILKVESAADPACSFSFASTSLWRGALSPNRALGPLVRRRLDHGHHTGRMLEDGMRLVFRAFCDGLACSELAVSPLGGALFGPQAIALLDRLSWGEHAVALLLDRLLWTTPRGRSRERVHYGALDVEDLGRIYEALLELEPGITLRVMSRLRRGKREVIVPAAEAMRYRGAAQQAGGTRVTWVEDLPAGRYFLRTGNERKASGAFYTPSAFVRFLVRETLAPQIAAISPDEAPDPCAILALRVVDPAAGSGHFLVEACRYLGEALYVACRRCDELATATEARGAAAAPRERAGLLERAAALRRRVADLPDPDGLLIAYLPSRAREGGAPGVSQSRALAICRRLVAVHCLYGVDNNRLAVELAKLSLWLESYAEGLPLTFLDHRLVHGDSTAGPFFASLATLPVSGAPLDPLLAQEVRVRLADALRTALVHVRALQATVGADAAALASKDAAKRQLDLELQPLRLLARAWSGAIMLATREADDEWLALARSVAAKAAWPGVLTERQTAMLAAGRLALPWDLTFPEVFWPGGETHDASGFDAVLSNPPWDVMQPDTAEFVAGIDLAILDAPGQREARAIRDRLLADPAVAKAWQAYRAGFVRGQRLAGRLYCHQKSGGHGGIAGGKLDRYRVFAERMAGLAGDAGAIGMVVPSAFHANEGATGVRKYFLQRTRLELCLSFENRKRLFDIHARYKFALIVARRPGPTRSIRCAFYLNDFRDLEERSRWLTYDRAFIATSGGAFATLLELRELPDLDLARRMFVARQHLGRWMRDAGIAFGREIHMSDDAGRFTPLRANSRLIDTDPKGNCLLLHEGKTIHQFTDRRTVRPRTVISLARLADRPTSIESTRYYRAACREIARATDERTAIATMLPPWVLCGHTLNVERRPGRRPNAAALSLVGIMNSFAFDWLLRQKAAIHVSLYILAELPVPDVPPDAAGLLAHGSLRLSCNHRGFALLWQEQLGTTWREPTPPRSWPVIASEDERWRVRAAMDAVVAHAYGVSQTQYERILASFSHRSFPDAAALCRAAFHELAAKGGTQFCRDHDPYWDIPLVTSRAQPVAALPDPGANQGRLPAADCAIGARRDARSG